jgi:hypothetical protein
MIDTYSKATCVREPCVHIFISSYGYLQSLDQQCSVDPSLFLIEHETGATELRREPTDELADLPSKVSQSTR